MRRFVPLFLLIVCGTLAGHAAERPNIVLIVADDLGSDLGCYGNDVIKTPHLDELARHGVRLTHAFATTASCSPSRSVILTGLHNHANGQLGLEHSYHHFRAFDDVKSLPKLLSAAGYRTARIGKLHVGPPAAFAFDEELPGNPRNGVKMAENCRPLIEAQSDKPFFLYFCPTDPHRSAGVMLGHGNLPEKLQPNAFGNKPEFVAGKTKAQSEKAAAETGYPGVTETKYSASDVVVPPFLPDTPVCRAELAQYYQSVSRVDQGVGRLMEVLEAAGQYDNTLIVFTSDHGMAWPGAKTTTYDAGLRVPMLVKLAGKPSPTGEARTSQAMVSHVDLVPTLLDAAGAPSSELKLHGRSWLGAIEEVQPKGWDQVLASHTFHEVTMYYPMRVIRGRQYKLIWNLAAPLPFPFASDLWEAATWQEAIASDEGAKYGQRTVRELVQRPAFELYDVEADPTESHNLADDPSHAERLAQMKQQLREFQKQTSDPWALKWDRE